jgi:hypothetical protein
VAVRSWDPTPYPDARERKVLGGEVAAAGELPIPRGGVLGFHLTGAVANEVRTAVSRSIVGPALIKSMLFEGTYVLAADSSRHTEFSLRWAEDNSGHGVNGVNVDFPAGQSLWESYFSDATAGFIQREDVIIRNANTLTNRHAGPMVIDRYVSATRFFLKLTMRNTQAVTQRAEAFVTLYEGVDAELAFGLMG